MMVSQLPVDSQPGWRLSHRLRRSRRATAHAGSTSPAAMNIRLF